MHAAEMVIGNTVCKIGGLGLFMNRIIFPFNKQIFNQISLTSHALNDHFVCCIARGTYSGSSFITVCLGRADLPG